MQTLPDKCSDKYLMIVRCGGYTTVPDGLNAGVAFFRTKHGTEMCREFEKIIKEFGWKRLKLAGSHTTGPIFIST